MIKKKFKFNLATIDKHGRISPLEGNYLLVNLDEPYAEAVYYIIKKGEEKIWEGGIDREALPESFQRFKREIQLESKARELALSLSPFLGLSEVPDSFMGEIENTTNRILEMMKLATDPVIEKPKRGRPIGSGIFKKKEETKLEGESE